MLRNDLKWNFHIDSIVKKASECMYFLRQLKRAKVPIRYISIVRVWSVIEYVLPVFHHALPAYLSDDLERLQKRALATILGYGVPYKEALAIYEPYTNAEASHAENYSEQLQMIQIIIFTIYYLTLITEVVYL